MAAVTACSTAAGQRAVQRTDLLLTFGQDVVAIAALLALSFAHRVAVQVAGGVEERAHVCAAGAACAASGELRRLVCREAERAVSRGGALRLSLVHPGALLRRGDFAESDSRLVAEGPDGVGVGGVAQRAVTELLPERVVLIACGLADGAGSLTLDAARFAVGIGRTLAVGALSAARPDVVDASL